MSTIFTAFYVDAGERHGEYLQHMMAGAHALELTNPGARYVVLTDRKTAPRLEGHVEFAVTAPDMGPLMLRGVLAQAAFEKTVVADLVILAAPDCIANRDLTHSTFKDQGLCITENKAKKINNVGYARDHDLTHWFLTKAARIIEGYPFPKQEWKGDQESWGDVDVMGRSVHRLPCSTHNAFPRKDGVIKWSVIGDAYILHFKGPRKEHLLRYVNSMLCT